MDTPNFKSKEEENDFNKIRVDSLGLSAKTSNALGNSSIRTVGGILRNNDSSLLLIKGLGRKGLEEIKIAVNLVSQEFRDRSGGQNNETSMLKVADMAGVDRTNTRIFNLNEEENDINKIRIDSVGFSVRTTNALRNSGIRTLGGIARGNGDHLRLVKGLGQKGLEEIKIAICLAIQRRNERNEGRSTTGRAQLGEGDEIVKDDSPYYFNKAYFLGDQNDFVSRFCAYFNIPVDHIKSSSRIKEIVYVRDLLIYFLRRYWELSFPSIGHLLGKDHSTVIFAYKKVKNKISSDPEFETIFNKFIKEVTELKERKVAFLEQTITREINERKDIKLKALLERTRNTKEIPERNIKILEQYRTGATLEAVASSFSVTRERIRQIVKKTIKDVAFNEAVLTGVSADSEELIRVEKEKRVLIKQSNHKPRPEKIPKIPRYEWSRSYPSCLKCGTTSVPHFSNGLCENCGSRSITGEAREKMIIEHENECDLCGISREESRIKNGRDFYLSRLDKSVLCMKCHQIKTGKKLGNFKKNKWRMFYR